MSQNNWALPEQYITEIIEERRIVLPEKVLSTNASLNFIPAQPNDLESNDVLTIDNNSISFSIKVTDTRTDSTKIIIISFKRHLHNLSIQTSRNARDIPEDFLRKKLQQLITYCNNKRSRRSKPFGSSIILTSPFSPAQSVFLPT